MASALPKISIRKGREWQTLRGHPWLFSGAISQAPKAVPGALVDLIDVNGNFVARGYFNPNCDIAVRVLSLDPDEEIDANFLEERISHAWQLRQKMFGSDTDAFRLVNAEGDFLPGFIADYFAGVIVVQAHTAGADLLTQSFIDALKKVVAPDAIVLRNDIAARKREVLELQEPQIVYGKLPEELIATENNLKFVIDVMSGQKTGFFADQRDKRLALQRYVLKLSTDAVLANCFCYTAAFSVYACRANQRITTINIDESARALEQAKRNFALNQLSTDNHQFLATDAFAWLDEQQRNGTLFDLLILDPPAFAKSNKDKEKALKGYFRMAKSGFSLVKPGGTLVLCSCSGRITMDEFMAVCRDAAAEVGRFAQFVEFFQHGCDHPINVAAPESLYLKVLFCRVA